MLGGWRRIGRMRRGGLASGLERFLCYGWAHILAFGWTLVGGLGYHVHSKYRYI
jgi:hypothetical protein